MPQESESEPESALTRNEGTALVEQIDASDVVSLCPVLRPACVASGLCKLGGIATVCSVGS